MQAKLICLFASAVAAGAFALVAAGHTGAQDQPEASKKPKPQYMFVQNADGVKVEGGKLILQDVSPTTLYFTDRPVRTTGHTPTTDFLALWGKGTDSFAKDPPNATLSIFGQGADKDKVTDVVVELSHPQLHGKDLVYDIHRLDGNLPAQGGPAALFIDWVVVRPGAAVVVRPVPVTPHVVVVR
ncbi:MAG: hypothetical protein QM778_17520 [Myxococcales bacterium]